MASNQTYIQKADLALADLSSGGLLLAEQVKKFFEIVIEESVLLPFCTTITMASPSWELSKLGFTGQVLHPGNESSALAVADRSKPELGKVTMNAKEFVAEARLSYSVVEDNIENGSLPQVLMRTLAKAVARDIEKVIIRGDTALGLTSAENILLATLDGVLKQMTTSVVNAGGVRLSKSVLKQMVQTLPSQYMSPGMVFISSKNAVIDYVDSLANRQTPKGDDMLVKAAAAEYMGYPIIPIPLMPENLGAGTNKTNVVFADLKNINVGFHREVRIETGRDIGARQLQIVISVRFDVKFSHEPATVKATEVLATAGP
jgi:HK97 family phage major capsid protein